MNTGDKKIVEIFAGWKAAHGYDHEMAAVAAGYRSYRTMKRRLDEPGTMTVKELRKLVEMTKASPEEVWTMVTGRRTR